jgi:hypothetical protein
MANEITTAKNTALGALGALRTGLQNVRTRLPETAGSPFLRLLKDGAWVFGQDDNSVPNGTEAVVNPISIRHGYSCWTNRQPGEGKNEMLGEIMVAVSQTIPAPHELDAKSDPQTGRSVPWKDQIAFDVKFIGGKHKGTQVTWKTSSVGGLNAARGILDAIIARLDQDTDFVCPIVAIKSDSYKHNTYGKTYVPVLEVVGWVDMEGHEEDVGEDEEAPKALARQPEPEPEPTPAAEEEPARRRRRV